MAGVTTIYLKNSSENLRIFSALVLLRPIGFNNSDITQTFDSKINTKIKIINIQNKFS